jgi:hypothetical protein
MREYGRNRPLCMTRLGAKHLNSWRKFLWDPTHLIIDQQTQRQRPEGALPFYVWDSGWNDPVFSVYNLFA